MPNGREEQPPEQEELEQDQEELEQEELPELPELEELVQASPSSTIQLHKFNMSEVSINAADGGGPMIVIIGRRGTGKTTLVRDLLYRLKHIPRGLVVDGARCRGVSEYAPMMPTECICSTEWSTVLAENLFRRQMHLRQPENRHELPHGEDGRLFLVLDNCIFNDTWTSDKMTRCLFMNGRHWKIMVVLTMGYPLGMPPVLRTNFDFAFLLFAPTDSERRRLYETYAAVFSSFEAFQSVFQQIATPHDYGCMVVCNRGATNRLQDHVKFYHARIWPEFRMECSAP